MKRSAMQIRLTKPDDIAQLQIVLDETGVFPREMLPDMIRSFFSGDSQEFWMTCEADGVPVGFCYTVPEEMAEGTWNMLAIGVRQSLQGGGHGSSLVRELEALLRSKGQRILIVDTSSSDDFVQARAFYRKNGYVEEARIRDFWAEGDDKITFWKRLG